MNPNRVAFFHQDHFAHAVGGSCLHVRECAEDGEAEVEFELAAGTDGISVLLSGDRMFPFLLARANADGHLLVKDSQGAWAGYVVECKKTLTLSAWKKALTQVKAGMVRLQFVADFLGIEVTSWKVCVAYREEKVSIATTPNPALLKLPIGRPGPASAPDAGQIEAVRHWQAGEVDGLPLAERAPLLRIALDQNGKHRVRLGA